MRLSRLPYSNTYSLFISVPDGIINGFDADSFVKEYFFKLWIDFQKRLRKRKAELITMCYEPADKKVSHNHFHFLINTDLTSYKDISNLIYQVFTDIKFDYVKYGYLKKENKLFMMYKGNGKPYPSNEEPHCPTDVARKCPFKNDCLNAQKRKSCPNFIIHIITDSHLNATLKYFKRDKITKGTKIYYIKPLPY